MSDAADEGSLETAFSPDVADAAAPVQAAPAAVAPSAPNGTVAGHNGPEATAPNIQGIPGDNITISESTLHLLQPGAWFNDKWTEWKSTLHEWKGRQREWKKQRTELCATKKATLDVFAVDDVAGVGSGEPLFSNFAFEDWVLLSIRVELHLLMFDQPTLPQCHLPFVYNKLFNKKLKLINYGFAEFSNLAAIIGDTVVFKGEKESLEPQLGKNIVLSHFVRLTEHHRRVRWRRIDAGDESALLHFRA